MIQADALTKHYGPTRAVDGLSFEVGRGEVVGFLGPNGAGKSTTIRMVTGFTPPTSGTARIDGVDVLANTHQARRSIGYLPESTPLYPEMRVSEYLDYRGRLLQMPRTDRKRRIDEVIEQCNLVPMRRRTIGRLSKGNKQRVGLAQALLHEPPVLILDEPTSGFDPNQIQQFRTLLANLKGRHTILLCTHILPEIDQTADRILILAHGKLVANGSPRALRAQAAKDGLIFVEAKAEESVLRETLNGWQIQDAGRGDAGWIRFTVKPSETQDPAALAAALQTKGIALRELKREDPGLESLFATVTAPGTAPGTTPSTTTEHEKSLGPTEATHA